jgi:hypothetical protein
VILWPPRGISGSQGEPWAGGHPQCCVLLLLLCPHRLNDPRLVGIGHHLPPLRGVLVAPTADGPLLKTRSVAADGARAVHMGKVIPTGAHPSGRTVKDRGRAGTIRLPLRWPDSPHSAGPCRECRLRRRQPNDSHDLCCVSYCGSSRRRGVTRPLLNQRHRRRLPHPVQPPSVPTAPGPTVSTEAARVRTTLVSRNGVPAGPEPARL